MERGLAGYYVPNKTFGETVRAFVPHPLPPDPPLATDGDLGELLESAAVAVGRLDGISVVLPDPQLFLCSYIRKEAVLSSRLSPSASSGN